MKEAPLFVRAYDLHAYLLDRFEATTQRPEVRQSVLRSSCHLLEALTLAVQGFDTAERARDADEAAACFVSTCVWQSRRGSWSQTNINMGWRRLTISGGSLGVGESGSSGYDSGGCVR